MCIWIWTSADRSYPHTKEKKGRDPRELGMLGNTRDMWLIM